VAADAAVAWVSVTGIMHSVAEKSPVMTSGGRRLLIDLMVETRSD
jgi:acid phosphatase class B